MAIYCVLIRGADQTEPVNNKLKIKIILSPLVNIRKDEAGKAASVHGSLSQ